MKSTLVSRLKRLEAVRQKQEKVVCREALIVLGLIDGERHLVMTGEGEGRVYFEERPGSGPQLSDFGEFHQAGEIE
jgi:hypothetical protein